MHRIIFLPLVNECSGSKIYSVKKFAILSDQDHNDKKMEPIVRVHTPMLGLKSCVTITLYIARLKSFLDGTDTGQMVLGMEESGESRRSQCHIMPSLWTVSFRNEEAPARFRSISH